MARSNVFGEGGGEARCSVSLELKEADERAHQLKPLAMQAAYGGGVAFYQQRRLDVSMRALSAFFELREELTAGGVDFDEPPTGVPLGRFYLAHACYNLGKYERARPLLKAYLEDVQVAGPQRVLNMPDGWGGKRVSESERKASRFRARACASEAQSDAHTMLAMLAEKEEGAAAALPHCRASVELAGVDEQKVHALDNLARVYTALGEEAEAATTLATLESMRVQMKKQEEEKARKAEAAHSGGGDADADNTTEDGEQEEPSAGANGK